MHGHRRGVTLLLLVALLTGVLLAGTPVNGDDSVAARTAGIHLTIAPTARVAGDRAPLPVSAPAVLALALVVVAAVALRTIPQRQVTAHRAFGLDTSRRRGPPLP